MTLNIPLAAVKNGKMSNSIYTFIMSVNTCSESPTKNSPNHTTPFIPTQTKFNHFFLGRGGGNKGLK